MKRTKTNTIWYDTHSKEIGGILLESRQAASRYSGLYPDARSGLRMMGAYPGIQTTIL